MTTEFNSYAVARLEWGRQCVERARSALVLAEARNKDRDHPGVFVRDPQDWFWRAKKVVRAREISDDLDRVIADYSGWSAGDLDEREAQTAQAEAVGYRLMLGACALWATAIDSAREPGHPDAFWSWLRSEAVWQDETWKLWSLVIAGGTEQ